MKSVTLKPYWSRRLREYCQYLQDHHGQRVKPADALSQAAQEFLGRERLRLGLPTLREPKDDPGPSSNASEDLKRVITLGPEYSGEIVLLEQCCGAELRTGPAMVARMIRYYHQNAFGKPRSLWEEW